jgi:hypothetical protein
MKRFLPLVALIGLCCLAVPLLTVSGGEKSDSNRHYPVDAAGACTIPTDPDSRSIDAEVVHDLTTILKETTSRETFLYTVGVLGKMGRTARPALPAIIRNAERLRFFTSNARGSEDYVAAMTDAIDCILEKRPSVPVQSWSKVRPSQPAPDSVAQPNHVCRPEWAPPPPPPAAAATQPLVPVPAR